MFFDIETRDEDRVKISELQKQYPKFEPVFIAGAESFNQEVVIEVKNRTGNNFSHIITTRLDNDDAVHEAFVQSVQEQFKGQDEALIDPISGYSLWTQDPVLLAKIKKPFNPFMSLIEKNGAELTTVSTRNHDHWSSYQNRIVLEGIPLWLQVIHGENQASQFGYKGWLVEGGYLSRELNLLDGFHLDMAYSEPPSAIYVRIYNIKVWCYHLLRNIRSALNKLAGRK
jgi:hypothetical protein